MLAEGATTPETLRHQGLHILKHSGEKYGDTPYSPKEEEF